MESISAWVTGGIAALATVIASYFTARLGKSGSRENQIIDQIQEERAAERQENAKLRDEMRQQVSDMRSELTRYRERDRISHDYIMRLRQHIWDGASPPPPEWPEDFTWV